MPEVRRDSSSKSKTASHEFRSSDYRFVVEKVAIRLKLDYFVLVAIFAISPFVLAAALRLAVIVSLRADYLFPYFFSELAWMYPGVLSVLVTSVLAKRLRNRTVTTLNSVVDYLREPDLFSTALSRTFRTRRHWAAATAFASVAIVIQTILIVFLPPPWWTTWYMSAFAPTVVVAILTIASTGITYFFAAMMAYFCLSTTHLLFRIAEYFETDTKLERVEGIRFRQIGELSLTVGASWGLGVGLLLAQLAVASITWMTILQVSVFLVLTITLFLAPLVKTHYLMRDIKERIDKELSDIQWSRFEELRNLLSATNSSQVRARITALAMLLQSLHTYRERIDRIPAWPLNAVILAELSIVILAQVAAVLLNSLLTGLVRP